MKTIIAILLGLAVVGGIYFAYTVGFTQDYQAEVIEKIIDNTPSWANDPDAVKAAEDVMRKKELQAELEQLESEVKEREVRIAEIEKDLGTY